MNAIETINTNDTIETINTHDQPEVSADAPTEEFTTVEKMEHFLLRAIYAQYEDERGMSTIEYALGCVAAAALGALLYTVVTSDTVENALQGIFERALHEG